jgi:hypothetical protein
VSVASTDATAHALRSATGRGGKRVSGVAREWQGSHGREADHVAHAARVDRIRELFGSKQSGAEHGAATAAVGGSAAATSRDDPESDFDQSDAGEAGGGESGAGSGGGADGGGGGGDGGGS